MSNPRPSTTHIVVHCSATRAEQDIGRAEIERWHRQRGFLGIGYHYVIRRNGVVEVGRPEDTIGAHVQGHNRTTLGICMVGGVNANDITKAENNYTPEQFAALKELLLRLRAKYPTAEIVGHRDFPNVAKACPSFDVKEWVSINLTT